MTEKTSKKVSSDASWLLNSGRDQIEKAISQIAAGMDFDVDGMVAMLKSYKNKAESVAGSALTQREP